MDTDGVFDKNCNFMVNDFDLFKNKEKLWQRLQTYHEREHSEFENNQKDMKLLATDDNRNVQGDIFWLGFFISALIEKGPLIVNNRPQI